MFERVENAFTVPPKEQPTEWKPGQLSQEQLEHFFKEGYLVVKDIIDKETLDNVIKEWENEV